MTGELKARSRLFCLVLLGYCAGAVGAWWLIDQSNLSAVLFPPAGVTVAALIMSSRRDWWIVYLAAGTAELAVNATVGDTPFFSSIGFVAANLIEPTVAAILLTPKRSPRRTTVADEESSTLTVQGPPVQGPRSDVVDLARRLGLARFLAAAVVVGPTVGATIGSSVAAVGLGSDFFEIWPKWWLGDALGVALIGSAILVWRATADVRPPTHPLAVVLIATSAALTIAIETASDLPVLFVVLIVIIMAGVQFGVRTVAILALVITAITAVAFARDPHGLIMNLAPNTVLVIVKLELLLFVVAGYVVAAEATERSLASAQAASEHETVESLHRLLLPPAQLAGPNFSATGIYRAATADLGVGGDWYDVITLPDQRVLITVGDIVGHSTTAARAMAQIRAILPVLASARATPADVIDDLDNYTKHNRATLAATTWIGIYQPDDQTLTYTSAGHPPGYLITSGGAVHKLDGARTTPLGIKELRPTAAVAITDPTTIVLYTDGLIERRRHPIDSGLARLEYLLTKPGTTPDSLVTDMLATSDHDDDTVLLWTVLSRASNG